MRTGTVSSALVRAALVGAGLGLAALLDGALLEPRIVRFRRELLPTRHHSRGLAGLRILHLSDLHVGGRGWKWDATARAIELCNESEADLVAITGDFIGKGRGVKLALELLSSLRRDLPRVAVLGNHDHVYGPVHLNGLMKGLRALGFQILRNDAERLSLPWGELWVAGVDDGYSLRDDLGRVRSLLPEDGLPRLFLTHYPEVARGLRPGEFDLSLAGHSHGGQVRLPFVATRVLHAHARTQFDRGLFRVNGNPLYVSAGLGMSGLPFRFLNLPEVISIQCVPASE
ncbi:MAG TPA: metallophosphoesterase [Chloroflexota bacterium]|nr:metallophosphoesterase [Chloroflexota bacterium]